MSIESSIHPISSSRCVRAVASPISSVAAADVPEALYIFPAGGQRGTTVDVRIGGMHLHDECPLHFDGDGVTVPETIRRTDTIWFEGPVIPQPDSQKAEDYPTDYAAKFSIADDARLGARWWRVVDEPRRDGVAAVRRRRLAGDRRAGDRRRARSRSPSRCR